MAGNISFISSKRGGRKQNDEIDRKDLEEDIQESLEWMKILNDVK